MGLAYGVPSVLTQLVGTEEQLTVKVLSKSYPGGRYGRKEVDLYVLGARKKINGVRATNKFYKSTPLNTRLKLKKKSTFLGTEFYFSSSEKL